VDWPNALEALKRARAQLDQLNLEQESSQNPAKFFEKVREGALWMLLCGGGKGSYF